MREVLPSMWLSPGVDAQTFLARLEVVASDSGPFRADVQRNLAGRSGWDVLNIHPIALNTSHVGLFGQAISQPGRPHPIRIEIRAREWKPDRTYDSYVAAGRQMFWPLIQAYNRKHGTKLHLYVQNKEALAPKLPPTVSEAFGRFVRSANVSMLHPLDWQRFYDFVIVSHRVRFSVGEQDLVRLLMGAGLDEEHAWEIANVYNHLYHILDRV